MERIIDPSFGLCKEALLKVTQEREDRYKDVLGPIGLSKI